MPVASVILIGLENTAGIGRVLVSTSAQSAIYLLGVRHVPRVPRAFIVHRQVLVDATRDSAIQVI